MVIASLATARPTDRVFFLYYFLTELGEEKKEEVQVVIVYPKMVKSCSTSLDPTRTSYCASMDFVLVAELIETVK
jgi:hypothetical protein